MPLRSVWIEGLLGNKEGAAVLVGLDGNGVGADPLGFVGDLLLIHADERTQYKLGGGVLNGGEVFDGLGGHLPPGYRR